MGIFIVAKLRINTGKKKSRTLEGESPLLASCRSQLVSRKVVVRKGKTEVSGTTKVGTDEQELHKRLVNGGKVAHHTEARRQRLNEPLVSRCNWIRRKEGVLTCGRACSSFVLLESKQSADAIVE